MMSENRFTVDGLNIQDNSIKGRLYLLGEQGGVNALCNLLNGLNNKMNRLEAENEELKKRLSLYDEDKVDKYLRTHPMPTTTTITSKRKVIPLNMRHRRY